LDGGTQRVIYFGMPLTLHFHPFASYCQKVLIALYENETPFEPVVVDLGDETSRAAFLAVWPIGKMPVLQDQATGRMIPESTIIIDYLDVHHPGRTRFVPADPDRARDTRLRDRFFDLYVMGPMQKIVGDRLRPAGSKDPFGVEEARAELRKSYQILEAEMASRTWATGDEFGLADCAAAPALFYADMVEPFRERHANLARYFERLMARPSFARVVAEAAYFMPNFPR
jgi:glutathione S-transferase